MQVIAVTVEVPCVDLCVTDGSCCGQSRRLKAWTSWIMEEKKELTVGRETDEGLPHSVPLIKRNAEKKR